MRRSFWCAAVGMPAPVRWAPPLRLVGREIRAVDDGDGNRQPVEQPHLFRLPAGHGGAIRAPGKASGPPAAPVPRLRANHGLGRGCRASAPIAPSRWRGPRSGEAALSICSSAGDVAGRAARPAPCEHGASGIDRLDLIGLAIDSAGNDLCVGPGSRCRCRWQESPTPQGRVCAVVRQSREVVRRPVEAAGQIGERDRRVDPARRCDQDGERGCCGQARRRRRT